MGQAVETNGDGNLNTNALPEPLVPGEVDLRDFGYMPLEFRRLFASDTWILGNYEERCAAFCLWCESWHGAPAGSLPDNDRILAHLSQAGARWKRLREHALRGWVKCSDGRLYHPVVAEKALEAWGKHKKASSKGKAGAEKRWGTRKGAGNGTGIKQLMPADSNRSEVNRKEVEMKGRKDVGNGQAGGNTPPDGAKHPDPVFEDCLKLLTSKGAPEGRARKFLGLMRQGYGDALVIEVCKAAETQDVSEPIPWIHAGLLARHRKGHGRSTSNAEAAEEAYRRQFGDAHE